MEFINSIDISFDYTWLAINTCGRIVFVFSKVFRFFMRHHFYKVVLSSINNKMFICCCLWSFRGCCLRVWDFFSLITFQWASERGDWMSVVARSHGIRNRSAKVEVVNKIKNWNQQTGDFFIIIEIAICQWVLSHVWILNLNNDDDDDEKNHQKWNEIRMILNLNNK